MKLLRYRDIPEVRRLGWGAGWVQCRQAATA